MRTPEEAYDRIVKGYEETQRLLPLAGGIAQPIERCDDAAVVMALAWKTTQEELANAEADRDRLLAALKGLHGWSHCIQTPDPYEELDAVLAEATAALAGR